MAELLKNKRYTFKGGSLPEDTFVVISFKGQEKFSALYSFEIELASTNHEIDFSDLINKKATLKLSVEQGNTHYCYHGLICDFEQKHQINNYCLYRVVIKPKLWQLTHQQKTNVYLEQSIPDIIKSILAQNLSTFITLPFNCPAPVSLK